MQKVAPIDQEKSFRAHKSVPTYAMKYHYERRISSITVRDEVDGAPLTGGYHLDDQRQRQISACGFLKLFAFALALAAPAFCAGGHYAYRGIGDVIHQIERESQELLKSQKELTIETAELGIHKLEYSHLLARLNDLKASIAEKDNLLLKNEQLNLVQDQVYKAYREHLNVGVSLRNDDLSKFVRTTAYNRYGVGPHQVKFVVREVLPNGESEESSFTVQLVSFRHMPVSSMTFLRQVGLGTWDGASLSTNKEGSILVRVDPDSSISNKMEELKATGLSRIPFHEYTSRDHCTGSYALAFGDTVGPSSPVNTVDATVWRIDAAPSGTVEPSCFASVISGTDVVERIFSSSATREEDSNGQSVKIVSATII